MQLSKIAFKICSPIARKVDGSTASGGGGSGTVEYYIIDDNDDGYFKETVYYSNVRPTTYSLVSASTGTDTYKWGLDVNSSGTQNRWYKSYLRFQNVAVPQGATINTATLTVNVVAGSSSPNNDTVDYDIWGLAADNHAAPTSASDGNDSNHTSAEVSQGFSITGDGSTEVFTSLDISTIISEITSRAGWTSGNALIIVSQFYTNFGSDEYRNVRQYNYFQNNPSAQKTKLTINYS